MSKSLEKKWYIIVNPVAGSGTVKCNWASIQAKLLKAGIDYDFALTKEQGHAMRLAKEAIEKGYRKLGVIGGDGSNHEVMNGIMQQQVVPTHEITQALIPVGTGNDWIRTHNLPKNIDKAIAAMQVGKTKLQDIGKADFYKNGQPQQRYFVNVAGMAYDGFVSKFSNDKPGFASNKFFYFYMVIKCLFKYTTKRAKIIFDGKTQEARFYTINIGICKYSGGGMQFVPQAVSDDGQFALSSVTHLSVPLALLSTPFMYGGLISKHPKSLVTTAKNIKIEASNDAPTLLELDGEYVGETPVQFTLVPKAFRFICN